MTRPPHQQTSRRVLSIHGAHPLSGVSTWIARMLLDAPTRHDWSAVVVGSTEELDAMPRFPGAESGRVRRLAWDADPHRPTARVDALCEEIERCAADVVVPNYVPEAYAAAALANRGQCRILAPCHSRDAWYLELFQNGAPLIDAAWCVSDECARLVAPSLAGKIGNRISTVFYGVPVPATTTPPPGVLNPNEATRLLYLGRLDAMQKRVLRLADLARVLDQHGADFLLTVAGDGPERARLAAQLAPWIAKGAVQLVGAVDEQRAAALIETHDLVVLVSAYEGTPLAAIEAAAAGRPVALSPGCGGAVDVVREYGGGVVSGDDIATSMGGAIATLARDRTRLAECANAAHENAQRCYSIEAHAAALDDLIDAAAAVSRRGFASEDWEAVLRCTALAARRGVDDLEPDAVCAWRSAMSLDASRPLRPARFERIGAMLMQRAVERLVAEGCRNIGIFPAGRHSQTHGAAAALHPEVACFIDDAPSAPALHAKPVLSPAEAIERGIDAVIVSSDQYEGALAERAFEWVGGSVISIETLYVPVQTPVSTVRAAQRSNA